MTSSATASDRSRARKRAHAPRARLRRPRRDLPILRAPARPRCRAFAPASARRRRPSRPSPKNAAKNATREPNPRLPRNGVALPAPSPSHPCAWPPRSDPPSETYVLSRERKRAQWRRYPSGSSARMTCRARSFGRSSSSVDTTRPASRRSRKLFAGSCFRQLGGPRCSSLIGATRAWTSGRRRCFPARGCPHLVVADIAHPRGETLAPVVEILHRPVTMGSIADAVDRQYRPPSGTRRYRIVTKS